MWHTGSFINQRDGKEMKKREKFTSCIWWSQEMFFLFHFIDYFFKAICSRFNVLEACCLFVKKHNISSEYGSRFVNETKLLLVLLLHHAINFARNFHWESFQHFSFWGRLFVTTSEKFKSQNKEEQGCTHEPELSQPEHYNPYGQKIDSNLEIDTTVNLERSLNARS